MNILKKDKGCLWGVFYIAIFISSFFTSCSINDHEVIDIPATQSLQLSVADANDVTVYSAATKSECRIEDCYVVAFDGTTFKFCEKIDVSNITSNGSASPIIPQLANKIENGWTVYVLCNTGVSAVPSGISSPSNINAKFPVAKAYYIGGDALPMSGKIDSYSTSNLTVTVSRAVAKVQIKMGSGDNGAGIEDVTGTFKTNNITWNVANYGATKSPIIPESALASTASTNKTNNNFRIIPTEGATDEKLTTVYLPEYKSGYDNAAFNKANQCLILKKTADGKDYFYRLDFLKSNQDETANKSFYDTNRNNNYTFYINHVKSEGYLSEAEALANPGSNLIYQIDVTDSWSGNIASDGQYAIAAEKDTITVESSSTQFTLRFRPEVHHGLDKAAITTHDYSLKNISDNNINTTATNVTTTQSYTVDGNIVTRVYNITNMSDLLNCYIEIRLGNIIKRIYFQNDVAPVLGRIQVILRSLDASNNGINGTIFNLHKVDGGSNLEKLSFQKVSEGVYSYVASGGTTELATATVSGQSGIVELTNIPQDIFVFGKVYSSPNGWGVQDVKNVGRWVNTNDFSDSWNYTDTIVLKEDNINPALIPIPTTIQGTGTWKYVPELSDEFNGGYIDQSKWTIGDGVPTVTDGYLHIPTTMNSDGTSNKTYVESSKRGAGYGYYEARIRCQYLKAGTNAFWLWSNGSGGVTNEDIELDIFEMKPNNRIEAAAGKYYGSTIPTTTHNWAFSYNRTVFDNQSTTMRTSFIKNNGLIVSSADEFWTYGLLYTPEKVVVYVNNEPTYEVDFFEDLPRDLNLKNSNMFCVLETHELETTEYTQNEVNNSLHTDGLKINTMYVDYYRYYERTDITYTDLVHSYPSDGVGATIPQTPQSPVAGTWTLQTDMSDEFNDNSFNFNLWDLALGTQSEKGGTLRLPLDGRTNAFNLLHPDYVKETDVNYFREDLWTSPGIIQNYMRTLPAKVYGKGYYEFRVKSSKTDYGSYITIREKGMYYKPFVSISLYGDAIDRPDLNSKAVVGIDPDSGTGVWTEPSLSGNSSDAYHIYGILVEDNSVSVYIDGTLVQNHTITSPSNMQIYVGYSYPTSADGDSYARLIDGRDVNFYIDYVRYYKK